MYRDGINYLKISFKFNDLSMMLITFWPVGGIKFLCWFCNMVHILLDCALRRQGCGDFLKDFSQSMNNPFEVEPVLPEDRNHILKSALCSSGLIYPYWSYSSVCYWEEVLKSSTVTGFFCFSCQLSQFLLHMFWHLVFWCIHIWDCYVLVKWFFYHCVMSLFVSSDFLC